jgi:hypothetical protein
VSDIELVISRLRHLEDFLRGHEVTAWADIIRCVRLESGNEPQVLKRRVLDLYKGTMGSLTDLFICRVNRHTVDDEVGANAELDRLRDELWVLA